MKKQKKILRIQILVFMAILLSCCKVFAADNAITIEFSEDYEKYLELSDEEKEKVIEPLMYDIPKTTQKLTNPLRLTKMLATTADSYYSLKDVIPTNMVIKNQQQTNSCWTFAGIGMLESSLALKDYKNGKTPIVYDFSERHMDYATSNTFKDGTNKNGFNRKVNSGGNNKLAEAYLTNGTGAISEKEMPFENNTDLIELSKIQNVNVITQVNDIVNFPTYKSTDDTTQIKQQIKEHIKNYGGVYFQFYGGSLNNNECYNNKTGAIYSDDDTKYNVNHSALLIGWDDNYSKDNFLENKRPKNNGAWIVKNSWGTENRYNLTEMKDAIFKQLPDKCIENGWTSASMIPDDVAKKAFEEIGYIIENDEAVMKVGDNGFMYISYEDVNIYKYLTGITDAQSEVTYDNIYQYDKIGGMVNISLNRGPKAYLATIFDKKTTGSEYLTQVSINAAETYTCKVYVNPNGTSKEKSDLQQVQLKTGETEKFDAGYHTIEFQNPVKITGESFVVVIEIEGTQTDKVTVLGEYNYAEFRGDSASASSTLHWCDNVTVANGKCFIANGENIEEWIDTSKEHERDENMPNYNTTIKAFTTLKSSTPELESIEIATQPSKISYIVGENFDKTGMVVKAKYSDGTSKEITDYTIKNGTNLTKSQTSITIEYNGKTAIQTITVKENKVDDKGESKDDREDDNKGNEEVKKPQNSNFDNMQVKVTKMKSYDFTDTTKKEYSIISVDISNITIASGNNKMEYYYYLASNPNEANIGKWIKIENLEKKDNKLSFEINTSNISNYEEISKANDVYLYIKEIAILNNAEQEKITKSSKLEVSNINIEKYIDGKKKEDVNSDTIVNPTPGNQNPSNSSNTEKTDKTIATEILPKAGKGMLMIGLILILAIIGRFAYIKYRDIQVK